MGVSWLKKIGQGVAVAADVVAKVEGLGPIIDPLLRGILPKSAQPLLSEGEDYLTKVGSVITTVEAVTTSMGTAVSGADKLRAATPLVMQVVKGSELLLGKKITNQAGFEKACAGIASSMADLLNSLE